MHKTWLPSSVDGNNPPISIECQGESSLFEPKPVYILINGGCLSTTAEFLTEVHVHHRATFIGEESAGCYYGPNSPTVRITLPNTKLGIFIPLLAGYMSVGGNHEHDPARGIIPDYPVTRTISDLLAGADRDLELALKLARKSQ